MLNEAGAYWPAGFVIPERSRPDAHLLLWVHAGRAQVRRGVRLHALEAGQLLVVPAGTPYQVAVGPQGLVVPIVVDDAASAPAVDGVLTLGAGWGDWMLHHFAAAVSPLRSRDRGDRVLAGLEHAEPGTLVLPRSNAANAVARELLRDPAAQLTVGEWAARVRVGERTLRRAFLNETGLSFTQWRQQCRLETAAGALRAGHRVAYVAQSVGFADATTFIRAFARAFGATPARWQRDHAAADGGSGTVPSATGARALAARLIGGHGDPPPIQGSVATPRTYSHVDDILWVYRGTARVRLGRRSFDLVTGDAIWMPAHVEHAVEVDAESIALPLVFPAGTRPRTADATPVVSIPPALRDEMLAHVLANLTPVRPPGYDRAHALAFLAEHVARERDRALALPRSAGLRAVAEQLLRRPNDARTLQQWGAVAGLSVAELNRAFVSETGRTASAWRASVRVQAARGLMLRGAPASVAARRVGYRHLSGFSRDFSANYGMPPTAYLGTDTRSLSSMPARRPAPATGAR